ncbi:MAG: hypothetical protein RL701_6130 [Pseudomonadota bacterium]|jgi:hypothetical protein
MGREESALVSVAASAQPATRDQPWAASTVLAQKQPPATRSCGPRRKGVRGRELAEAASVAPPAARKDMRRSRLLWPQAEGSPAARHACYAEWC